MRYIVLVAFLASVFGCTSTPSTQNPIEGKALVIASNDPITKVLLPLSTTKSTNFEALDGKEFSGFWNLITRLELEPGEHSIVTSCRILRGGLDVKGQSEHKLHFEAGKIYSFSAQLATGGNCVVSYEVSEI